VSLASLDSRSKRAAGSHQPDSNRGFRYAIVLCDLFGRSPLHLLFEQAPLSRAARLQDASDIDRRQVDG
jgi:hypothetical protein